MYHAGFPRVFDKIFNTKLGLSEQSFDKKKNNETPYNSNTDLSFIRMHFGDSNSANSGRVNQAAAWNVSHRYGSRLRQD